MKKDKRWLNSRAILLTVLLVGMTVLLCYGLWKLTISDTEAYQAAVKQTSEVTLYQSGRRGSIVDRNGVVLAYDETTYNVLFYRDPNNRTPVDSARYTNALLRTVEIIEAGGGSVIDSFYIRMEPNGTYVYDWGTESESAAAARRERFVTACNFSNPDLTAEEAYLILRESWQIPDDLPFAQAKKIMSIRQEAILNSYRAFEGVVIAYDVSLAVVAEIDMLADELTGVTTEKSSTRVYPCGTTACHLIGYLGKQVTGDMTSIGYSFSDFAAFTDHEETNSLLDLGYSYSDLIGVAGVEKSMEACLTPHLTSRQGQTLIEKKNNGAIADVLGATAAEDGLTVQLTVDIELQKVVEQALIDNIEATRQKQEAKIAANPQKYLKLTNDLESIHTANSGAIVVMDVNSGEVLAMASYPNYDPNVFTDGISDEDYALLFGEGSNSPTLNRAIASRNMPGSVFKMATGFAGLMEGKITTTETISDHSPYYYFVSDPTTKVEQNAPSCWTSNTARHANLTLSRAITVSCNYYFFTVADRVGVDRLVYWAGRLGLSGTTGVELPGELSVSIGGQAARYDYTKSLSEQSSSIPQLIYRQIYNHLTSIILEAGVTATNEQLVSCASRILQLQTGEVKEHGAEIRNILRDELNIPIGISLLHTDWIVTLSTWLEELRWKPTYTIQTGIGQGVMLLTPISLARYASTLANRGTVYQATVVDALYNADGSVYEEKTPTVVDRIDAPDEYWQAILDGMQGVVSPEDGGTASSVFSDEFTAKYLDKIIGKTGTAQTGASDSNIDIENTCFFIAVTPRDKPEIAIVVYIPYGLSGSSGHVAVEEIVTYWYERENAA